MREPIGGQLGAGCLARVSDAQDSDANWWKEDDVDALSGAGTPGSPSWVSITKNTRREERFVQLQPRTCGPAAGFCPWLGQQMTRVCRRCPGRRADEQREGSLRNSESRPGHQSIFRVSALLAFSLLPFPSPSSSAPLLPPWLCVLPIIALCQHFPSLTLPFGLRSLSTAPSPSPLPSPSPSPSFDRTILSFRNAHTEKTTQLHSFHSIAGDVKRIHGTTDE
jgi:hypothetical protein